MSILRRRIRGILGMSLVWGVGFTLFGALLALVVSILDPSSMDTGETIAGIAALMGTVGAVGGALFGVMFAVSHRRSTFKELSLSRVATWGLVGGALIPVVFGKDLRMGLIFGPVGAVIGACALALARRAPDLASAAPVLPPATTFPPGRHGPRGSGR